MSYKSNGPTLTDMAGYVIIGAFSVTNFIMWPSVFLWLFDVIQKDTMQLVFIWWLISAVAALAIVVISTIKSP